MIRSYTRITVYIAREFLLSFVVSFLFFFFIFFINQMLLLAEEILTRRVPPLDVARLVFYSLPSIVAIAFPFGALVGALMAVGRFSSDNEVIAFQASGIPHARLFAPLLALGLLFSVVSFVMNDYFLPLGTINFARLYRELVFANPELELEPFTVKSYQRATIATGEVSGREIRNLLILDTTDEGERRVIAAERALLTEPGGDAGILSLLMGDVTVHTTRVDTRGEYAVSSAQTMEYNILLQDVIFGLRTPGPREMASADVWRVITDRRATLASRVAAQTATVARLQTELAGDYVSLLRDVYLGRTTAARARTDLETVVRQVNQERARVVTDRTLSNYELEFHKKYSIPFACVSFVLFAFPVGLLTRKAGRTVGFGVGLLVSTLYWSLLLAGQTVGANNPSIPPALAMWAPNVVILLLGSSAYAWKALR